MLPMVLRTSSSWGAWSIFGTTQCACPWYYSVLMSFRVLRPMWGSLWCVLQLWLEGF